MNLNTSDIFDRLGITVLERGWLSSNNTVICDRSSAWVVDTGYGSHAHQTVALIDDVIQGRFLQGILNTHLHSDHCGGNAALQLRHPKAPIAIPPGQAAMVDCWDTVGLTYDPTGQHCPRFTRQCLLVPNTSIKLAGHSWQILAAPGHDPHAILLFEERHRVLISGDALWRNGFGVVFPELEGGQAFEEVGQTLDLIEKLQPQVVIPGHGPAFTDVAASLERARNRLRQFQSRPDQHAEYAAKVLIKFHLLELQQTTLPDLAIWYRSTPYFGLVQRQYPDLDLSLERLLQRLTDAGAVQMDGEVIRNA